MSDLVMNTEPSGGSSSSITDKIILSVEELKKFYASPAGELPVLKGVSLKLERGRTCAIMGPSGAGKSTLLQIIGGLDHPSSGEITVAGEKLSQKSSTSLALFRNRFVGFVFQFHHLLPEFTARENVAMPILLSGGSRKEALKRADELLASVGLSARALHRPSELSGGEQQRTAIARALALTPPLLLADEPTGNLDETSAAGVQDILFAQVKKTGGSMIIVTHDVALAERADMVYHLDHGVLKKGPYTLQGD